MPQINSQTFPFAPSQNGISQTIQTGTVLGVPLDGSAQITVPFLSPFAQICQSVVCAYTPASETDYQVAYEIIGAPSVSAFVIVATGGPTGTTGTFIYTAVGY